MTSRELVENAARRKSSGGTFPIFFHFADNKTKEKYANYLGMDGASLDAWLDNDLVELNLIEDVQFRFVDPSNLQNAYKFGFALDKNMPNAVYDVWGCAWSIEALGQELRESPIQDFDEVYDYPYPDPNKPNLFFGMEEKLAEIHDSGHASMISQYFSLFERAWAMTGYTNFLEACYTDTEAVEYLLDRIIEYKVCVAEKICKMGVTLGHTGDDYGLQRGGVMSLDMFRKLFKPRYEKLWGVYKKYDIPVVHHSCGDCSMYLADMIDAGLDVLHPVQQTCMDIRKLSELYGNDLSFMGSIDTIDVLTNGSPDDVRRNVDETVEILGKHNGLILSMINVLPNVPEENVKAAILRMKEYRGK